MTDSSAMATAIIKTVGRLVDANDPEQVPEVAAAFAIALDRIGRVVSPQIPNIVRQILNESAAPTATERSE